MTTTRILTAAALLATVACTLGACASVDSTPDDEGFTYRGHMDDDLEIEIDD